MVRLKTVEIILIVNKIQLRDGIVRGKKKKKKIRRISFLIKRIVP